MVAIETVSNFLILEEYAANRDATTWNAAVDEALKPFSVTVIQCTSDLAAALNRLAGIDRKRFRFPRSAMALLHITASSKQQHAFEKILT